LHFIAHNDTYTLRRTALNEKSARRRGLYLTAHNIYKRKMSGVIRTYSPRKREAAYLRLRPRGFRDRLKPILLRQNVSQSFVGRVQNPDPFYI
jgi:hypothetical protein